VIGDLHDPWGATFCSGIATSLHKKTIPDLSPGMILALKIARPSLFAQ
jgi:hypothetical protein